MQIKTQTNPVYKGYIRWNCTNSETQTIKKKEEWIIRKGNHPAILSEELFDKAQKRYQEEYHPKGVRASSSYKHWLSGMVKCSACGRSLSYSKVYHKEKNHSFFQCCGYNKKICSVSHGISERKLVSIILASLHEAVYTGKEYEWIEKKTKEEIQEQEEMTLYLTQIQLEKLKRKEERIYNAYINGIDTLEEYKRNKSFLLKEKEKLEQQSAELLVSKEQIKTITERKKQISDIITAMESDNFTNIEKNEALRSIIEKIVYDRANGSIVVYYHCSEYDCSENIEAIEA